VCALEHDVLWMCHRHVPVGRVPLPLRQPVHGVCEALAQSQLSIGDCDLAAVCEPEPDEAPVSGAWFV
jgi:hypothetical protein